MNFIYSIRHNLIKFYIYRFHKKSYDRFFRYENFMVQKMASTHVLKHMQYLADNLENENYLFHILKYKNAIKLNN